LRPSARSVQRRASPLRIVAVCLAWWTATLWLVSRVPQVEAAGVTLTIATVRGLLRLTGLPVTLVGHVLSVRGIGFEIAPDCSPHLPFLVFAGGVLAAPATWRQKALGLVLGAVLIHAFNTLRILALFGIEAVNHGWFDFAHVYLWQVGTILAVLAAFVAWLEWTHRKRAEAA
jgi:exosortase/archaeosortase family protein